MPFFTIQPSVGLSRSEIQSQLPREHIPCQGEIIHSLLEVERWVKSYLARPHPEVGRKGSVCPYIPAALQRQSVSMTYLTYDEGTTDEEIEQTLLSYKDVFLEQNHHVLNSWLVVFVYVPSQSAFKKHRLEDPVLMASGLVERVQRALKPSYIAEKLMIGQFYPGCSVTGIHNTDFKPFATQYPLIGIRHMMPQDLVFISEKIDYIQMYLDAFGIADQQQLQSTMEHYGLNENERVKEHMESIQSYI